MKFLHTSDLHIGKRLYDTPLTEDQSYMLGQIVDTAKKEGVDAILIAGDIYDRSNPSEDAVELYDRFLAALSESGIPTFIIPGNHDSAVRTSFGSSFMADHGIIISGGFSGTMEKHVIEDASGPVNIWMLPFFRDAEMHLPEGSKGMDAAFRKILEDSGVDPKERNILISHQFFVSAGTQPDTGGSERCRPSVGGEDCISSELLRDFDYVALGHIHRAQSVGRDTVRYSGTPMKYSETECFDRKGVVIGEIGGKGEVEFRTVTLTPLRDLRTIEGTVEQLVEDAETNGLSRDDYVYIRLTENSPDAKQKLSRIYPNILSIVPSSSVTEDEMEIRSVEEIRRMDPVELFSEMFRKFQGKDLSGRQLEAVREAVRRAKEAEI